MAYQHILVPLDGSKLSEQALSQVGQVAKTGASIRLLSVMAPEKASEINALARSVSAGGDVVAHWPPVDGVEDPRAEGARSHYLAKVQEWLEAAGFDVTVDIQTGDDIAALIVGAAATADVIIMASYQKPASTRLILGSIAEAVLQHAPCPVLIVPGTRDQ
jgi:nucleotide-binding universal stress UspA family protein